MVRARKPAKSLRSAEHRALCALLIGVRRKAGLNQAEVAERLGKPQSFVAKYEGGERRLDVVEFLAVSAAIGADPGRILRDLMKSRPKA
jgi:transcriptional regulator with XRE-family HTH domain